MWETVTYGDGATIKARTVYYNGKAHRVTNPRAGRYYVATYVSSADRWPRVTGTARTYRAARSPR